MDALLSGKSLEGNPELAGGIMLKTCPGRVLEFHQQNCHLLQEIGVIGDPNSSCCSCNAKNTSRQRKIHQISSMFFLKRMIMMVDYIKLLFYMIILMMSGTTLSYIKTNLRFQVFCPVSFYVVALADLYT